MSLLSNKISFIRKFRDLLAVDNRFYAKLLASSAVGVLAISLLALILLFVAFRDHKNENLRSQTLEVLRESNKIDSDLATLETAHRGFLLTGQENYLESFDRRKAQVQNRLHALNSLVAGNSQHGNSVSQIRQTVDKWFSGVATPTIERRRTETAGNASHENARSAILEPSLLDSASKELRALQEKVQVALNERTKDEQSAGQSFEVLMFTPKLERVTSELENAGWGYLLTGANSFLDQYRRVAAELYAFNGHLSVLLAQNPEQLARLSLISQNIERWQREIAIPAITAKQANKDVAQIIAGDSGRKLMNEARSLIAQFEKAETASYEKARSHSEIVRILKTLGFGLLCLLAIAVLVASSWYSFVAYVRHLRKIENAEQQTRSIIENTVDGVITINDQGLVRTINPAAEKMFGSTAAEILNQNISKLIPQRLFVHDMTKLGRGTMIAMGHRQGFYPFPIEISLSEMLLQSSKCYVAMIRDVSARRRSEETLKHIGIGVSSATGKEFVRSLVRQLSKALQSDFAFIVEKISREDEESVCSIVIAEEDQIRTKQNYRLSNTACEETLKKGFQLFKNNVREEFPTDEVLRELNAESFVAMPLTDNSGKSVGIMGVIHRKPLEHAEVAESTLKIFAARAGAEIERKRFEDDLGAERERLAVTLRSIGDGFITTDVDGKVLMINKVAERLTGWSAEQAVGRKLLEVFNILNERTRKPCNNAIERIIETGAVVGTASQTLIVSREGTERLIENSASPIRDRNNRKVGVVIVFRDVTEKQKLEEERRKAEKLESLGVAAGGIAHDFNNLLTAIIGNLSLALITLDPDDELSDRLTTAKKASLRAQELSQQLLTFAKGGSPIKKAASVAQLIEETVSFSLRGSSIRSEFSVTDDLWPVEIDSGQISQVISNLTINAEQAMPAGGTLRVSCENYKLVTETAALTPLRPGNYVKITVQDEGIGIPDEYLKKIFDPYFTTKPKGSGLGLATSYSIVKNHDGLISVESKPGAGAQFTIYLPASEKEVAFVRPTTQVIKKGKGKILVLDDEEVICMLVTHALTPLGYQVSTALEGLSAIKLYQEAMEAGQPFDALISDLTIPGGMGGQDTIKRLLEINPNIKAIVSSGYANDPIMSRYKDYGFCACISKPYELSDLGALVHEVVNSKTEKAVFQDFAQAQVA